MGIFSNKNGTASGANNSGSTDGFLMQDHDESDQAMMSSIDDMIGHNPSPAQDMPVVEDPEYIAADEPVANVPAPTDDPHAVPVTVTSSPAQDLQALKQQALQQLTPLVDHLNQTPEEKFHTTMMLLQATDNQTLIHVAYEAAQAIPDEKARAQALLDVVNEINYFTANKK